MSSVLLFNKDGFLALIIQTAAIGRRISDISSSKELFNKAKPHYESALKQSGHDEELIYIERKKPVTHTVQNSRKNRQRNIIWFNPPYSMNVQTNIGREFLNLVSKHFPKNHRYSKIFNKNNMKVSYSCTDNLQTIIKKHNRKILETSKTPSTENNCNCRKKNDCPLKNNCLTSSVVYNANVTTENDTTGKNYIGLTEGTFKQRYTQHKLSFRNRNYSNKHGTIKAYLDTERQQHQFYNKLEYFSDRPGLQQHKQAVPLVPNRKTLLS